MDGYLILTMFMLVIFFFPILMFVWFLKKLIEEKIREKNNRRYKAPPPIPTDIVLKKRAEIKETPTEVLEFAKRTRRCVGTTYFTIWFYDDIRKWEVTSPQNSTRSFEGQVGRYVGYKFSYDDVVGVDVQMRDCGGKVSTFSLVSRALVGSALGGDTGAIIGGMTAKEKQYVEDVSLVVFQNRRSIPEIILPLFIGKCKTDSGEYENAMRNVRELKNAFRLMNAKD